MFFDVFFHFFLSLLFLSFILHLRMLRNQSDTVLILLFSLFPLCFSYFAQVFPSLFFQVSLTRTKDYVASIHGSPFNPFSASSKTLPLHTYFPLTHTRTLSLSKTQKTCYGLLVSSFSGYIDASLPSGISANPTERTVSLVPSSRGLEGCQRMLESLVP